MNTILDIFRSKHPRLTNTPGEFGVEIETETLDENGYPSGFWEPEYGHFTNSEGDIEDYMIPVGLPEWKAVHDGSLRNYGKEFVLLNPLNFDLAVAAVRAWGNATKNVKFLVSAPSTSVHVHLNITKFTMVQLVNLITILIAFENLLTEFSGPTRRSNLYARPTRCADNHIEKIKSLVSYTEQGKYNAISFADQYSKYGVINLATLCKYGSLEIRCFRGTTNADDIIDWLKILNKMYQFAQTPGLTPLNFYKTYQENEFEIVDLVFAEEAKKLKSDDWHELLLRNEWYLADISTMSQNWYEFGSKFDLTEKAKPKKVAGDLTFTAVNLGQLYGDPVQPYTGEQGLASPPDIHWSNESNSWVSVSTEDEDEEGQF